MLITSLTKYHLSLIAKNQPPKPLYTHQEHRFLPDPIFGISHPNKPQNTGIFETGNHISEAT